MPNYVFPPGDVDLDEADEPWALDVCEKCDRQMRDPKWRT